MPDRWSILSPEIDKTIKARMSQVAHDPNGPCRHSLGLMDPHVAARLAQDIRDEAIDALLAVIAQLDRGQ